jgi:hypothetical protein
VHAHIAVLYSAHSSFLSNLLLIPRDLSNKISGLAAGSYQLPAYSLVFSA